ncbi:MAG: hypothetical protein FWG66_13745 [Spirochaetes bacterium]|nr:hypothetical protein [Spirochaetota bacterium]
MAGFSIEEKEIFDKEYNKVRSPRPTVLVCGWSGSGKSSLISAMLDVDAPISHGQPGTQNFDIYENDLIRVYDSKGMEKDETVQQFVQRISNFVQARRTISDIESNIHLVWYAVDVPADRFDSGDIEIVKELYNLVGKRNVVFALTKADVGRQAQMDALRGRIKEAVGVTDRDIIAVCDEEGMNSDRTPKEVRDGASELMNHSRYILPDALRDAWDMAQKVDIERKLEIIKGKKSRATAIIAGATTASAGAAAVPIPIGNTVAITGIQVSMVASLAALYTIGIPKESILPFIASVVGRQAAASLVTLIPGVGSVINAGVAASFTGGIGAYCSAVFEKAATAKAKGEKIPAIAFDAKQALEYIKNVVVK